MMDTATPLGAPDTGAGAEATAAPATSPAATPYSGGWLDRASASRIDPAWVRTQLDDPRSRLLPMWRDRCLVTAAAPLSLPTSGARGVLEAADAGEPVFLGLDGGAPVFTVDLSPLDLPDCLALAGADDAAEVRALVSGLSPAHASVLAYARGVLSWHRNQQFCGTCGARTSAEHGGHMRQCTGEQCARQWFPRIEPAVLVLIESPAGAHGPARCLLARHHLSGADSYSTVAGFVEVGESLEDAVRREVAEETGVAVGEVAYHTSQAWPFPAGIMLAFRARATSDVIAVDGDEIVDAHWFTRAEVAARAAAGRPPWRDDSIGKLLVGAWLAESD
jgi:NAD+ diphosphatase